MLAIRTIVVTPFMQNARLLWDTTSQVGCVVDPGGDIEEILKVIADEQVSVQTVLLTHAHLDHAGGVMKLLAALPGEVSLIAHRLEREMRRQVSHSALLFGLSPKDYQDVREPDLFIEGGDRVQIGRCEGQALFTPGHSPGHLSLYFPQSGQDAPILIAGDTLFSGSIGRTDLPGGDHQTLIESIHSQLLILPEETKVLSGHGPDTTIGREKRTNPFLEER